MPLKRTLLFLSLATVILACSSSPKTSFYQLKPINTSKIEQQKLNLKAFSILISPIKFPEYLDYPQIVIRKSDFKFQLSENHHWAEPLENEFTRVLIANINNRIAPNQVFEFSQSKANQAEIHLSIEVLQLDANTAKQAILVVKWASRKGESIKWATKTFKTAVKSNSYESKVKAQSLVIALFSDYLVKHSFD